jgi:hypothetical protein
VRPLTPREAMDEFWRVWLAAFKCALMVPVLIFYFIALVLHNVFICLFISAEWLLRYADNWEPTIPGAFALEEEPPAEPRRDA